MNVPAEVGIAGSLKLLPCPHCGEVEHLYPTYRALGAGRFYAIDCLRCGYDFVPREELDTAELWNKRFAPNEAALGELIAALTDMVIEHGKRSRSRMDDRLLPATMQSVAVRSAMAALAAAGARVPS